MPSNLEILFPNGQLLAVQVFIHDPILGRIEWDGAVATSPPVGGATAANQVLEIADLDQIVGNTSTSVFYQSSALRNDGQGTFPGDFGTPIMGQDILTGTYKIVSTTDRALNVNQLSAPISAEGLLSALNQVITLTLTGQQSAGVQILIGTFIGTLIPEITFDGVIWTETSLKKVSNGTIRSSAFRYTQADGSSAWTIRIPDGAIKVRIRVSAYTSGSTDLITVAANNIPPEATNRGNFESGGPPPFDVAVIGGRDSNFTGSAVPLIITNVGPGSSVYGAVVRDPAFYAIGTLGDPAGAIAILGKNKDDSDKNQMFYIRTSAPNAADRGLVTRNIPSGTQNVSLVSSAAGNIIHADLDPVGFGDKGLTVIGFDRTAAQYQFLPLSQDTAIRVDVDNVSTRLNSWLGSTDPTVGQKTKAFSIPVVVASDQGALAVTGPLTDAQLRASSVPVKEDNSASILTALNSLLAINTDDLSIIANSLRLNNVLALKRLQLMQAPVHGFVPMEIPSFLASG